MIWLGVLRNIKIVFILSNLPLIRILKEELILIIEVIIGMVPKGYLTPQDQLEEV